MYYASFSVTDTKDQHGVVPDAETTKIIPQKIRVRFRKRRNTWCGQNLFFKTYDTSSHGKFEELATLKKNRREALNAPVPPPASPPYHPIYAIPKPPRNKTIKQARYGSSVASYFHFYRWLVGTYIFIASLSLVWIVFHILKQVNQRRASIFSVSLVGEWVRCNRCMICCNRYRFINRSMILFVFPQTNNSGGGGAIPM